MKKLIIPFILILNLISCGKSSEQLKIDALKKNTELHKEELKLSNDLIDIDAELEKIAIKEKHQDIYPNQAEFKYNLKKTNKKLKLD